MFGPGCWVLTATRPRSPGRVRDQRHLAQNDIGVDVKPHDLRPTVTTQVARSTTLANATALLGHADESTTARHYVQRIHVAIDVRVVIDRLIQQTSAEARSETQSG